jgi:DNA-binding PadR family transcriptional regulator/polyisoprenoid-binding protein YceI
VDDGASATGVDRLHSRFELAPPRRFLLPALLLLLSEHPGHGYSLVKDLASFRFGAVDRPSVYRALAHLEADALVESSAETPRAGHERRVYRLTLRGERFLRSWMVVIKEERDRLDHVLRRYQATGTADAALAALEGGFAAMAGASWSPVVSSPPTPMRAPHADIRRFAVVEPGAPTGDTPSTTPARRHFRVNAERSVILIDVRSSVGPLSFGALGMRGSIEATMHDATICFDDPPVAHVEIAVDGLRSGNSLYDAELLRRIDARRFPTASIELRESAPIAPNDRYRLAGDLTFHGVTRPIAGTVTAACPSTNHIVVNGEQAFDIRDFGVESPTVLMLRIYPDVKVHLHVEGVVEQ